MASLQTQLWPGTQGCGHQAGVSPLPASQQAPGLHGWWAVASVTSFVWLSQRLGPWHVDLTRIQALWFGVIRAESPEPHAQGHLGGTVTGVCVLACSWGAVTP